MKEISPGVWMQKEQLLTQNLVPGSREYGEELKKIQNTEFRVWDPNRSKPAAALKNGLRSLPLKEGSKILYLGIANGNTASFFSDIIGKSGLIYGIEISPRPVRDLLTVAKERGNIVPVLANARTPDKYDWIEKVDMLYQDVATRDQVEIMKKNSRFLKKNGELMLALKAKSIDVTQKPEKIYGQELKKLSDYKILEKVKLDPFEKDHLFLRMKKKSE